MKIIFIGASHEVTGSCTMLENDGHCVLVDCGMEQGADIFENSEIPTDASRIEAIIVTHAHIDHTGKIPLMYKNGFRGKIIATAATCKLMEIMLKDSAHIQKSESDWRNRKAARAGGSEHKPVYTDSDVDGVMSLFISADYGEWKKVNKGMRIRFTDSGHLLGSASVTVEMAEKGESRTVIFSGDIGNIDRPLVRNPEYPGNSDYVVIESTYGDRYHETAPDYAYELSRIIQRTLDRGGNVVIPSFAVGRTQEILYIIRHIKAVGLVSGHDGFPVYVDSPLAVEATEVFMNCDVSYFDEDTAALIDHGINPLDFEGLRISVSTEESKAINFDGMPKVILASSGMCEAGRIRHHLKHNLWRPESTILFVGYQSEGTLGRILYEGAEEVKLFGETIAVKAEIASLAGISGHADKAGLVSWITKFTPKPELVFVNHGDDTVCDRFADTLCDEYGISAVAPYSGTSYDLITGNAEEVTVGIRKRKRAIVKSPDSYDLLLASSKRLTDSVRKIGKFSRKDAVSLIEEIDKITDAVNEINGKNI